MEFVFKRDRLIVLAALIGITTLAWGWMIHEARGMGIATCCQMATPDINPWGAGVLPPLFFMWAEMMAAMMVPSAAPMILTFATVQRRRREQERPFVPTGFFLSGYLFAWTIFSALAAVVQWILHTKGWLSPMMAGNNRIFGGALLIAAGIFQWTPLKNACLVRCRSPLNFLLADWREGKTGAFGMGLKHGAYCTGCCWLLMLLLFVAGVMNLYWIAAIAIFVLLEKVLPKGFLFGKVAGVVLIVWGLLMLVAI